MLTPFSSPGHVPPVASNHPFLPRIHLPLPGGTAGEHGRPIRPWGARQLYLYGAWEEGWDVCRAHARTWDSVN